MFAKLIVVASSLFSLLAADVTVVTRPSLTFIVGDPMAGSGPLHLACGAQGQNFQISLDAPLFRDSSAFAGPNATRVDFVQSRLPGSSGQPAILPASRVHFVADGLDLGVANADRVSGNNVLIFNGAAVGRLEAHLRQTRFPIRNVTLNIVLATQHSDRDGLIATQMLETAFSVNWAPSDEFLASVRSRCGMFRQPTLEPNGEDFQYHERIYADGSFSATIEFGPASGDGTIEIGCRDGRAYYALTESSFIRTNYRYNPSAVYVNGGFVMPNFGYAQGPTVVDYSELLRIARSVVEPIIERLSVTETNILEFRFDRAANEHDRTRATMTYRGSLSADDARDLRSRCLSEPVLYIPAPPRNFSDFQ